MGLPLTPGPELSAEQQRRYARQILLPGLGVLGQRRLAQARVAVVGAGGLGGPVLQYLAAAGVGHLTIIDPDVVQPENLHRQVLFGQSALGFPKVAIATDRLMQSNPDLTVRQRQGALTRDNAQQWLADCDVVVDGTDNFAARYAISDACVRLGVPCVWAALGQFSAQLTVFWAGRGPCYRCVFPVPPAPGAVPSCAEAGVFGALCGTVGSAQAGEVLKLITGLGHPLVGRLLVHDALQASWDELPIRADPQCLSCALGEPERAPQPQSVPHPAQLPWISVAELHQMLGQSGDQILIDLRTAAEREQGMIPGAIAIRFGDFMAGQDLSPATRALLPNPRQPVVLYCASGGRSTLALAALLSAGYDQASQLNGGWLAWSGA